MQDKFDWAQIGLTDWSNWGQKLGPVAQTFREEHEVVVKENKRLEQKCLELQHTIKTLLEEMQPAHAEQTNCKISWIHISNVWEWTLLRL